LAQEDGFPAKLTFDLPTNPIIFNAVRESDVLFQGFLRTPGILRRESGVVWVISGLEGRPGASGNKSKKAMQIEGANEKTIAEIKKTNVSVCRQRNSPIREGTLNGCRLKGVARTSKKAGEFHVMAHKILDMVCIELHNLGCLANNIELFDGIVNLARLSGRCHFAGAIN
jgi:hypothetical protein